MRLIDADALKEHKFVGNKFVQIGGRTNGKTLESINKAYQQGWNDCIDAIIDNAPTVHHPNCDICEDKAKQYSLGFQDGYLTGKERPQGEWGIHGECPFCSYIRKWEDDKFCGNCGAKMKKGGDEE